MWVWACERNKELTKSSHYLEARGIDKEPATLYMLR